MAKDHACSDPKHHVHDAAGFVHAVERACNERGLRLTAIRARVLSLVAEAGKPIKAYDLLEQVRDGEGAGARIVMYRGREVEFGVRRIGGLVDGGSEINRHRLADVLERPQHAARVVGERLGFGSTTGNLWVSEDQGDSWETVSTSLPPIHEVRFTS